VAQEAADHTDPPPRARGRRRLFGRRESLGRERGRLVAELLTLDLGGPEVEALQDARLDDLGGGLLKVREGPRLAALGRARDRE